MGIPSPVTRWVSSSFFILLEKRNANKTYRHRLDKKRTSAGSMYHSELARQIADFVASCPTMRGGIGMMPLTDVYCLYNRARGTGTNKITAHPSST